MYGRGDSLSHWYAGEALPAIREVRYDTREGAAHLAIHFHATPTTSLRFSALALISSNELKRAERPYAKQPNFARACKFIGKFT